MNEVELFRLVESLATRHVWVAPVGNYEYRGECDLRGFMVCRRSVNNADGCGNTRIDYLLACPGRNGAWKKPFKEALCMFPTLEAALATARDALAAEAVSR